MRSRPRSKRKFLSSSLADRKACYELLSGLYGDKNDKDNVDESKESRREPENDSRNLP